LSNFGAFGGLHATMVVVPPQVAIVGAGRIFERIVAAANGPEAHRILPLSITIDHRVVTGVEACRFLVALATDLELAE
jgi:pyruvate dehydrogenase E2 component (dihydrolipoamide acetyltransferase)